MAARLTELGELMEQVKLIKISTVRYVGLKPAVYTLKIDPAAWMQLMPEGPEAAKRADAIVNPIMFHLRELLLREAQNRGLPRIITEIPAAGPAPVAVGNKQLRIIR